MTRAGGMLAVLLLAVAGTAAAQRPAADRGEITMEIGPALLVQPRWTPRSGDADVPLGPDRALHLAVQLRPARRCLTP